MITPEQIYQRYLTKSEKNGVNDYLSTDRGRFVELYNELAPRVCKWYLNNRNKDDIIDINILLVDDVEISESTKHLDHQDFKIPLDFLSWSFMRGIASKGECIQQDVDFFEIKNEDRHKINSEFFSPSFSFREFPYNYSQGFIKVYIEDGVIIDKIILSYYKYPEKIKLISEDNPEGGFSQVTIKLPDEVINRIVSAMVADFKMNNSDPNYQIDKLRQLENLK